MNSVSLDKTDMLIAKFMECEFYDDGRVCYSTEVDDYVTENPMWDSSWDWIMPVVQECKLYRSVNGSDHVLIDSMDFFLCNNDLLGVYEAVVEFIKEQK